MKSRENPNSPCEGCSNFMYCKYELKACRAFKYFVTTGEVVTDSAKKPSRKIYLDIFHSEKD